jgi:UDP-2,3-diacylglucosamine pyrophosphatase LpxH
MKFLVITDLHQGMKHQKDYDLEQIRNFNGLKINLADCVDYKNCLKKDLLNLAWLDRELTACCNVKVQSNHEGTTYQNDLPEFYFHGETKTLFCHGHQLKKNYEKYRIDCQTEWKGTDAVTHYWKGIFNSMFRMVHFNQYNVDRACELMEMFNANTLVCGHFHPSETIDMTVEGKRIIVLSQGVHEINL